MIGDNAGEITWDEFKTEVEIQLAQHGLDGSVVVSYIDTNMNWIGDIKVETTPKGPVYIQ